MPYLPLCISIVRNLDVQKYLGKLQYMSGARQAYQSSIIFFYSFSLDFLI